MTAQQRSQRARELYLKWLDIAANDPHSEEAERAWYEYQAARTGNTHYRYQASRKRIVRALVICALLALPVAITLALWLTK